MGEPSARLSPRLIDGVLVVARNIAAHLAATYRGRTATRSGRDKPLVSEPFLSAPWSSPHPCGRKPRRSEDIHSIAHPQGWPGVFPNARTSCAQLLRPLPTTELGLNTRSPHLYPHPDGWRRDERLATNKGWVQPEEQLGMELGTTRDCWGRSAGHPNLSTTRIAHPPITASGRPHRTPPSDQRKQELSPPPTTPTTAAVHFSSRRKQKKRRGRGQVDGGGT
jgi:hypothetical protein